LPVQSPCGSDQLEGRAGDPSSGGEPESLGWQPDNPWCQGSGGLDVRHGNLSATNSFGRGLPQPDTPLVRQSPPPKASIAAGALIKYMFSCCYSVGKRDIFLF